MGKQRPASLKKHHKHYRRTPPCPWFKSPCIAYEVYELRRVALEATTHTATAGNHYQRAQLHIRENLIHSCPEDHWLLLLDRCCCELMALYRSAVRHSVWGTSMLCGRDVLLNVCSCCFPIFLWVSCRFCTMCCTGDVV